ncbi:thiamine pyrophosphate-binding protein [Herbiconiux sp. A18JL235]|uniref:2-succinyl-5-enolpyruvyl-6-hydroxy-3-cyclohexene-1-carboxylate synthase n=1 Tax=Herbiconiux sp. A18JL235 TaxID=3152363 RepID=A0AB39BFZ8_9MICO
MTAASPAATFSARLVRAFAALGVKHAVVSPGSRSQSLALALAELEQQGVITVHVRIDERVAAFTALGIGRESGRPALVVTTSGTAVANLLPAVVEASHSGVPMIVLSADRPASLRGTGSNQTTIQPGMFGEFARAEVDLAPPRPDSLPAASDLAAWAFEMATDARAAGPVHLNLQFVEPLSGEVDDEAAEVPWESHVDGTSVRWARAAAAPDGGTTPHGADAADAGEGDGVVRAAGSAGAADAAGVVRIVDGVRAAGFAEAGGTSIRRLHLAPGPRTLVIAGADAGEAAADFARGAGWPMIAEASSGSRFGPNLVGAYRTLLDHPDFGGRVERAVVFGHPTLSRQVPALLARADVETVVVAGRGAAYLPRPDTVVVDEVTADPEDRGDRAARSWTGQWVFAGRELMEEESAGDDLAAPVLSASGPGDVEAARAFAKGELAALKAPITRRSLALAVWRASWPHDRLVLGASRLVREVDAAVPGKKIPVHANRGLAGIDGTISTAIGVAIASQGPDARPGTTRVLLGDLAFLHDVGALLRTPGERMPRVQLVVGNDGGGTIFDGLEVAGSAERSAFDRVMYTPQDADLGAIATAYGWTHRRVERRSELDQVLLSPAPGCSVVEVALGR